MRILFLLLFSMAAQAQLITTDDLESKGIRITGIEIETFKVHQCEVYYWHADDPDQDGRLNNCINRETGLGLPYNPCDASPRTLIKYVLSGGTCLSKAAYERLKDAQEDCDQDFSPRPAWCD